MKLSLTVREVARLLHTSDDEIYRWIRQRGLPARRVDDQYRVHKTELLEWATSRGIRVSSSVFSKPVEDDVENPRFAQALERGGVHHAIGGADRAAVLRAVVEHMPIEPADREETLDFLVAREALGSTGVGDGIAIPHVRNPVVLHVEHPSITLCFLDEPVDFEAVDKQPVHTLFTLVSRTVRSHLFLLSRLSAALHDPGFKRAVVERAPAETILAEARRLEAAFAR